MKSQHGLILTQEVEGNTLTLSHVNDNTFELTISKGTFTVGKGAYFADGTAINQPKTKANRVTITKAEMKRLGTYKLYLNGKDVAVNIFGKWIDRNGRQIIFGDETDVYYYFNRPDCGLVQLNNINGKHCTTEFHYALGKSKDKFGNKIEVLNK